MSDTSNNFFSSIKGSIKGRLSRSSSNVSQNSADGHSRVQPQTRGLNPFSDSYNPPVSTASNEPPPAYSAVQTPGSGAHSPTPTQSRFSAIQATTPDDEFAFLSSFDTIFLIDDSGSMAGRSWREVQTALAYIAPICTAHDADGIDIYFLNHRSHTPAASGKPQGGYTGVNNAAAVQRIFNSVQPGGMTPTGTRLNHVLKAYLRRYEKAVQRAGGDPDATDVKPINVIMITDGKPSDDPESVLLSVAQKLGRLEAPPHQVGVQFFRVGNDQDAIKALTYLDDELKKLGGGVRDMVDTTSFNGSAGAGADPSLSPKGILKTVLGAVVKNLDRTNLMEEERRSMRSGMLRP